MTDYDTRAGERGSIEPRRAQQGLGGIFDWDPFRSLFPGTWHQLYGVEVTRREDGYEVEIPVPGYRPEDLEINYQDGIVTVSGRTERRHFTRSFALPEDVDEENMQANVEHGMLILKLRQHPKRQPRRISIGGTIESTAQPASKS